MRTLPSSEAPRPAGSPVPLTQWWLSNRGYRTEIIDGRDVIHWPEHLIYDNLRGTRITMPRTDDEPSAVIYLPNVPATPHHD